MHTTVEFQLERALLHARSPRPLLVTGPAGSGKVHLTRQVVTAMELEVEEYFQLNDAMHEPMDLQTDQVLLPAPVAQIFQRPAAANAVFLLDTDSMTAADLDALARVVTASPPARLPRLVLFAHEAERVPAALQAMSATVSVVPSPTPGAPVPRARARSR